MNLIHHILTMKIYLLCLYTEIPEGLDKECKTAVSNSPGPGCITFDFNMPGSIF